MKQFELKPPKFMLQDVEKPVLYREMFPYHKVPRVVFDNKIVPMHIPEEIFITDTTFRDGQQARPPYSVKQIVDIFEMLHRLGGNRGIIRQSEFFLYSQKDKEAVTKCFELGYKYPEITGWIRAVKEDFKLVKEMGLKETGILTSVSDYHIFLKLKKSRQKAMDDYLAVVEEALNNKIRARCHFEDITRADYYGFVVPFAQELMSLAEKAKFKNAVKIRLCDTMGYGVPSVEASLPRSVPKLVHGLIHDAGVKPECLEWHGHNDFHKVLANAVSAWLYGCSAANGTLLGFGERTGNPPIEGLLIEYMSIQGSPNGINSKVITEMADYFQNELGINIPSNYPFVGKEFNVTSAGIHADGVIKNEEIYSIFDTKKILGRPLGITITDKSGTAGIAYWVNQHVGLSGKSAIDKRHPGITHIYNWVMQQYEDGRTTSISAEEMGMQARKFLPELFTSEFDRLKAKALNMAENILKTTSESSDIISMSKKKQEEALKRVLNENPFIQRLYVTSLKGIQITDNVVDPVIKSIYKGHGLGDNKLDCVWVTEVLRSPRIYISDFYKSIYTDLLCLSVSAPIFNKTGKKLLGILVADIKFEDIARTEE
jgi:isopropylmalate/homocitrate/citramalate synthase